VNPDTGNPLPVADAQAADGTAYVVSRTGSADWGGGIGLTLTSQSSDGGMNWTKCPYDAADYAGLRFRARGDAPVRLQVLTADTMTCDAETAGLCAAQCNDHLGATLELDAGWTDYALTWEELHPEGWATPTDAVLDPTRLIGINWQTFTNEGEVTFGVDQVEFLPRDGWSFRSGFEGAAIGSADPTLVATTVLGHDPATGSPGLGSLALEIPFSAPDQGVNVRIPLDPTRDLTGRTLTARVRVDNWDGIIPANPPGAMLFVTAGDAYCWAGGGWVNLAESPDWITLRFDLDEADFGECVGGTITDVRELGVNFGTSPAGADGPAALHVDSLYLE